MSDDNEASTSSSCANCGIAEVDDTKLKNCTACFLVKYCGVTCQKAHRKQHKRVCKKRVAELRDELLFKQPESNHLWDCPICCLPLPIDMNKSFMMACCCKVICSGCYYANLVREQEARLARSCLFCREPVIRTEEEANKRNMKRVEANDPFAMCKEGVEQSRKGNYSRAFEYYTKAAELGDVEAHYCLSLLYRDGLGVEQDSTKEIHHLEEAAIGGHPDARYNLGANEWNNNRNTDRAVKHWIIAATQGHDGAIKMLMKVFKQGFVEKDVLAATLRAQQTAAEATKSPQRELADELYRDRDSQS